MVRIECRKSAACQLVEVPGVLADIRWQGVIHKACTECRKQWCGGHGNIEIVTPCGQSFENLGELFRLGHRCHLDRGDLARVASCGTRADFVFIDHGHAVTCSC